MLWARVPDKHVHLLIRACRDRSLQTEQGQQLFAWLSALPIQHSYGLEVPARRGQHQAHTAWMQVRSSPVTIKRPLWCSDPKAPEYIQLWALDVREDASTVQEGEEPVHWRLLSTHVIETREQALQCIGWYLQRWHIEQLFRTLKSQGLDVESSLVEEAQRLQKLAVLACSAASRTMQLTLARDGRSARPAQDVFLGEDVAVLQALAPTLEGRTQAQKNPHPALSLAWASWVIARLGGWKGYASERKPGPITMLHGLQAFERIAQGWLIARSLQHSLVCIR